MKLIKFTIKCFLFGCCIGSACFGQQIDRYVVNVAICQSLGKFPPQVLKPVTYGFEEVGFEPGDYSAWTFSPTEPAKFIGPATIGSGMIQGVVGATFDGLKIVGQIQIREAWTAGSPVSKNLEWVNCEATTVNGSPFRVRYGATNITFRRCYLHRTGAIPASDVVAIYFSDSTVTRPCEFSIIDCDFAGYSDGVQLGGDSNQTYGHCVIEDCDFWIPSEYLIDSGRLMASGLENAIDVKGKTAQLDITNCRFEGFRPSLYSGGGGVGYPLTLHDGAHSVNLNLCTWINCEAVVNVKGLTDRNIRLNDCVAFDIRNNGAVTPWTSKQGAVITATGTIHVNGLRYRADRLEEFPAYPYAPSRTLTNCEAF